MNKSDLIDSIAEHSGLSKKDAEKALNALIDSFTKSLSEGEEISLANFGSFKVKTRASRKGRNPQTGDEITIPERKVVVFSAGKSLRESVAA